MHSQKTGRERERELLEERAGLIVDHIRATPDILKDVEEAMAAEQRGEAVSVREYLEIRGREAV